MVRNEPRSEWYNYYKNRQNDRYRKHIETKYADFIDYIINSIPNKGKEPIHLHEAGCGAGNVSLAVYKKLRKDAMNFHITMSDKCKDMLELAHENLEVSYKAVLDVTYDKLPEADVVFSHGVLEHFDDETIVKIISNQLFTADKVIHYVPSNKYEKPSFGDERLLTVEQWQEICNPTSIIEFNDGLDLILTWDMSKMNYPDFIFMNDKLIRQVPGREGRILFEDGISIPKTDAFFLNRKSFCYPSMRYQHSYDKTYRYPTPTEMLIYGNK